MEIQEIAKRSGESHVHKHPLTKNVARDFMGVLNKAKPDLQSGISVLLASVYTKNHKFFLLEICQFVRVVKEIDSNRSGYQLGSARTGSNPVADVIFLAFF